MGTAWVECWKCDECGHRWIKGETWPSHCASSKCRKRTWNRNATAIDVVKVIKSDAPPRISTGTTAVVSVSPPTMNPAMQRFLAMTPTMTSHEACDPDVEMCKYKEYDQESGETMGCGLPVHGGKQRHGNWRRL